MTLDQAIKYFGSPTDIALALKISRQSVNSWATRGFIPPYQQLRLQELSKGVLIADPNDVNKEKTNY